jgi:hypothetical protein
LAAFLQFVYRQCEAWDRSKAADDILQPRFAASRNDEFLVVYEKTALLDRVYGTNVFDAFRLAQHIVSCNIDSLLKIGDPTVVSKIRSGHGIRAKKKGRKEKDLYSFATKYASWHRPDAYPIYDGLIGRLLPKLNRRFPFYNGPLSQQSLRDYSNLIAAIDSLTANLRLKHLRYKKIDKALWLWAKYRFRRKQLNDQIRRAVSDKRQRLRIWL